MTTVSLVDESSSIRENSDGEKYFWMTYIIYELISGAFIYCLTEMRANSQNSRLSPKGVKKKLFTFFLFSWQKTDRNRIG